MEVLVLPRAEGRVSMEVSRELRDKIRELSWKHNLTYEDLLWKALELFTQGNTQSMTQSMTPGKVEVRRRDYFWWTIRVGEGWNTIETDLNTIQVTKLCQAKLLAREVCEKIGLH
jgi:hypothetical protein